MHLLAQDRVRGAEGADGHFLRQAAPREHHCVQPDWVLCVRAVEAECAQVGEDEVALCELVELEFDYLRSVLGGPALCDLLEGFDCHSPCAGLREEVLVCCGADH